MNSVSHTSSWLISVTQNRVLNSFCTLESKHLWFLNESQGMKSGIFMKRIIWYSLVVKQYIVIKSFCGSWCRKTFWLDKSFSIKRNDFFFPWDKTYISCHKSYFIVLKKNNKTFVFSLFIVLLVLFLFKTWILALLKCLHRTTFKITNLCYFDLIKSTFFVYQFSLNSDDIWNEKPQAIGHWMLVTEDHKDRAYFFLNL